MSKRPFSVGSSLHNANKLENISDFDGNNELAISKNGTFFS
jgi:hypothetical protein